MHPHIQRDINQKVDAGLITLMDAKIINKYLAERQTIRGLEPLSLLSEYQCLIPWAEYLQLSKATTDDIYQAKAAMDAKGLQQNTLRQYVIRLRRFYEWMAEQGHPVDIARLNKIKVPEAPVYFIKK